MESLTGSSQEFLRRSYIIPISQVRKQRVSDLPTVIELAKGLFTGQQNPVLIPATFQGLKQKLFCMAQGESSCLTGVSAGLNSQVAEREGSL